MISFASSAAGKEDETFKSQGMWIIWGMQVCSGSFSFKKEFINK